jgi:hypothetical protein
MTERPILFSGPMVRALVEGRKTQTRRPAKFVPLEPGFNLGFSDVTVGHYCTGVPSSGFVLYSRGRGGVWQQRTAILRCPFGEPGDRLWVRETWAPTPKTEAWKDRPAVYAADGRPPYRWLPYRYSQVARAMVRRCRSCSAKQLASFEVVRNDHG